TDPGPVAPVDTYHWFQVVRTTNLGLAQKYSQVKNSNPPIYLYYDNTGLDGYYYFIDNGQNTTLDPFYPHGVNVASGNRGFGDHPELLGSLSTIDNPTTEEFLLFRGWFVDPNNNNITDT